MNKIIKKIALLYGGESNEYDVSVRSAKSVYQSLINLKYEIVQIDIKDIKNYDLLALNIDFAFIICHGGKGEDGRLQAYLEILGIPFSGSQSATCSLAMNKNLTKLLLEKHNITSPKGILVKSYADYQKVNISLKLPLAVKPNQEGSSFGISKIKDIHNLEEAIEKAKKSSEYVLIEEWIEGKEYTVGYLAGKALTPILVKVGNEFYDYEAKYIVNSTEYLFFDDKKLNDKLKKVAMEVFKILEVISWGRVDMIVDENSNIYILEFNPVPGMTDRSLIPMASQKDGLNYEQTIEQIIKSSLDLGIR